MKKRLFIYLIFTLLAVSACVESEIDRDNLHYETGVTAFNEVEKALDAIFIPLDEALLVDAFSEYIDDYGLADGSNLLEVWLDAEDLYFPDYRVRNSGNLWSVVDGADTLFTVDTGGESLFATGSIWSYIEYGETTEQVIGYIGEGCFMYRLSGYSAEIYNGYYFLYEIVDAELVVDIEDIDKTVVTRIPESDFNLSGNLKIISNTYYSYWGGNKDGYREVEMTATFPESIPLRHKYWPNHGRFYSEGSYIIDIEDLTLGMSGSVDVTIVPVSSYSREVTVIFRGDTVVI